MAVDVEYDSDFPPHRPSSDEVTVQDGVAYSRFTSNEKRSDVATVVGVDTNSIDECPDGGWRAWMALLGVSLSSHACYFVSSSLLGNV